jgi:hypothetical protein
MLKIRPAGFCNRSHVEAIAALNEVYFIVCELILREGAFEAPRLTVVMLLRFAHGTGDGKLEKLSSHGEPPFHLRQQQVLPIYCAIGPI